MSTAARSISSPPSRLATSASRARIAAGDGKGRGRVQADGCVGRLERVEQRGRGVVPLRDLVRGQGTERSERVDGGEPESEILGARELDEERRGARGAGAAEQGRDARALVRPSGGRRAAPPPAARRRARRGRSDRAARALPRAPRRERAGFGRPRTRARSGTSAPVPAPAIACSAAAVGSTPRRMARTMPGASSCAWSAPSTHAALVAACGEGEPVSTARSAGTAAAPAATSASRAGVGSRLSESSSPFAIASGEHADSVRRRDSPEGAERGEPQGG